MLILLQVTVRSHWMRCFFGSRHFFTGFPVKRIDIVTGQSIEVSSDYASCLCLMKKVSIAKRVGHMPSPHWDVQHTVLRMCIFLMNLSCGKLKCSPKEKHYWWHRARQGILSTKHPYKPNLCIFKISFQTYLISFNSGSIAKRVHAAVKIF